MSVPEHPLRVRLRDVIAVAAAAGILLAACGRGGDASSPEPLSAPPPTFSGVVRDPRPNVSGVVLPDLNQGGAPFALAAEPGGLLLVYFGFTGCPDVCPTTLGDLRKARRDLGDLGSRMKVAMVTIDPARDTAATLPAYLAHFFDDGHALRTEDPVALAAAQAPLGVEARRNETTDPSYYTFDHTATVFAVDENGDVVLEWPYGTSASAMAADARALLEET